MYSGQTWVDKTTLPSEYSASKSPSDGPRAGKAAHNVSDPERGRRFEVRPTPHPEGTALGGRTNVGTAEFHFSRYAT